MQGSMLLLNLIGAVALLLWGVRMVRTGMTRAFGPMLRRAIGAASRNRVTAFAAGIGVTGVLQSSTATALLLSSFAGRGLITLAAALAVMLGADVGSTVAAQIFSFKLGPIAPALLALGVFLFMGAEGDRPRALARIAIGLGLMLLSLQLISAAATPLRESPTFAVVLRALDGETALAVLIGALITWAAHSSLSMVLLVMSLAASGAVGVPLALALTLGINCGGAIAPYAAQAGQPAAARRVPLGNVAMRAIGALALLPFVSMVIPYLSLIEPEPARMVVNFHTAFNVALALLFLPLVDVVAWGCRRLLPDPPTVEDAGKPRYLDPGVIDTPSEALACALREALRLGDLVADMLRRVPDVYATNDQKLVKELERSDDQVDRLYEAIKLYLIKVSRAEMSAEESGRYVEILSFVTNLEHVGDIIDKNLMELAAKKIRNRYAFSPEGMDELRAFHAQVMEHLQLAFNVLATRDKALARRLLSEKAFIREAEMKAADSHFQRLREGRPESIETSSIHIDIVRDLKRINSHLTSVAYPILEAAGELRGSRLREQKPADAATSASDATAASV